MIQFPNVQTKLQVQTKEAQLALGFLPPQAVPVATQAIVFNPNAPTFNVAYDIQKAIQEELPAEKRLPKNLKETYEVLDMISMERTSKNRRVFDIGEIKQIAKNLEISPTGNKTEIVRRVRQAVLNYHKT